jgi:hypothetical protein
MIEDISPAPRGTYITRKKNVNLFHSNWTEEGETTFVRVNFLDKKKSHFREINRDLFNDPFK